MTVWLIWLGAAAAAMLFALHINTVGLKRRRHKRRGKHGKNIHKK